VPGGYVPGTLAFSAQMSGVTNYPAPHSNVHTPGALDFVDAALGEMVHELKVQGLFNSTEIIIEAKHGQSPINPAETNLIGHAVTSVLTGAGVGVAQNTDDDVALVWLKNQAQTNDAVTSLTTAPGQGQAAVQTVLSGGALARQFGNPLTDPRTPDLIVEPTLGTIYSHSAAKVAEHGGFNPTDTNVALLVANGVPGARYNNDPVHTTQIAPTILKALGLDPLALDAVRAEHTHTLPGF
jgi:arylsulfatase A-like enzyme